MSLALQRRRTHDADLEASSSRHVSQANVTGVAHARDATEMSKRTLVEKE